MKVLIMQGKTKAKAKAKAKAKPKTALDGVKHDIELLAGDIREMKPLIRQLNQDRQFDRRQHSELVRRVDDIRQRLNMVSKPNDEQERLRRTAVNDLQGAMMVLHRVGWKNPRNQQELAVIIEEEKSC